MSERTIYGVWEHWWDHDEPIDSAAFRGKVRDG